MAKKPIVESPSRLLASRVMMSTEGKELLRKVIRQGRALGWSRAEYKRALVAGVVAPMALAIERRVSSTMFNEGDLDRAAGRLLRLSFSINGV